MSSPLGDAIRRARARNGLSQSEVANKLGVVQVTISNWENGKSSPDEKQLKRLKRLLGNFRVRRSSGQEQADSEPDQDEGASPFGVWLNRTRLKMGYSIAELAEASGVSIPALYGIEAGRISNPRAETRKKLERALDAELPDDVQEEVEAEASIEGLGSLTDFDPHDDDDLPDVPGVYVFYDVSNRPIYVGMSGNIRNRVRSHQEKFWFRSPIVESASYIQVSESGLRKQLEKVLIRFLKTNAVINQKDVDR